jgi:hypothetical protein
VITDKKLTVYWDNITEDSWKAGSRKVNCNLAALLPDRSGFAPVTGTVKGAVAVGNQPAAPAPGSPTPRAPASSTAPATTVDDAPPSAPVSSTPAPEGKHADETSAPPSSSSSAPLLPVPSGLLPAPASGY